MMKMRSLVFFLITLLTINMGMVYAQNLDINDQSGEVNDTVSFTISINNAPDALSSVQFDVSYDTSVLDFTDNFTNGDLVSSFIYFEVNEISSGQIRVAGITTTELEAGSSGEVVKLEFTVKNCTNSTLTLTGLVDEMSDWSTGNGKFSCTSSQTPTPNPTATVSPTPATTPGEPGIIVGTVVDIINTSPVSDATVSTNTGGHSATTGADGSYSITGVASGTYTLTASATGYDSSSQTVTVIAGATVSANFALTPSTITPPPTVCETKLISVSPTKLTLKRKKSGTVTVTVMGAGGCSVEGETVTAIINMAGKNRISISPTSDSADEYGQTTFTITAKKINGNARITFKAGAVKKSITVKVRR
jgi:hypothetical protein